MNRIRYTEELDSEIIRLREAGYSTHRIGKMVKRSGSSVAGRLRHLGIQVDQDDRPVRGSNDTWSELEQRRADDKFVLVLAMAFRRRDHLPAAQRLAA